MGKTVRNKKAVATHEMVSEEKPAHDEHPAAEEKANTKRLPLWAIIPVAAVVVIGLGFAVWWFTGSTSESLIFKDDFSSPDSGWDIGASDLGGTAYSDGEFKIYTNSDSWKYATNDKVGEQADYIVEVDARKITPGEDKSDCSILLRLQDKNNYYGFYIRPLGEYSVWKRVSSKWITLRGWTKSDHIKHGASINKLKAACQGNTMDFFVNGHRIDSIKDDSLVGGTIALSMTGEKEIPVTEYRFDNFRLYAVKESKEPVTAGPAVSQPQVVQQPESQNTSSDTNVEWLTYKDKDHGYSVEYPSTWTLNTFMSYITVLITEPDSKARIITCVLPVGNIKLDALVKGAVDYQKQNYVSFELIADNQVTHGGVDARIIDSVYQEKSEKPLYKSSQLYIVVNEKRYSVELQVTPPENYDSYKAIFQHVLASFHVP